MKKVILLLAMSSLIHAVLPAQSNPEGMNYQAVARNSKGEILVNQPIALKVILFSLQSNGKQEYYNEVHDVVTSPTGVFSLVIGKGKKESGVYENIPWSLENIWMEVSIKSKGQSDFAVISNSRLLAVPYAYHSLTAEKLTGESVANAGNPSQSWLLFGNRESNPAKDKLGTTDSVDLVMVTNNLERLRIYANGNIFIRRSLRIGADLNVDSSAYLNRVGGATINYGPFTVDRQSPTMLSGILTVDEETDLNSSLNVDGITDLNSNLNVNNNSPSVLTGTLRVDGVTDLNNALNVNNMSPIWLTGTLQVDKDASFYEKIKILSTHQTDTSGAPPSGSLQVGGGAYIARNLYIGGIAKFGGPAAFGGAVTITDPSESTSTSTGALMIPYGGVGIGKRLNVGGGALFSSTLGVAGLTSLTNTTESTAPANGALVLAGGAGIGKNVNIGGNLTTAGITTINNTLNVNASSSYIANFVNSTNANGISIQVGAATPANANNFVTFKNSSGTTVGRIEGETLSELQNSTDYKNAKEAFILQTVLASVDLTISGFEVAQAVIGVVAASSSSTACVGFGACITAPIPSFIIASGTNLVLKIANAASKVVNLAYSITTRNNYVNNIESSVGVTYQSGAGDYAEWLPKLNLSEKFLPGNIVGMKNGKITLNTTGADKLLVVSTKPIVLGNTPAEGNESAYEKIAFLGQVPVFVLGKANPGDYILPSGSGNGIGIAVSPDKMKTEDYTKIVGMAWSASENETFSKVNVAIGLNDGDISKVVSEQSKEIISLKTRINETNSILAKLVPGFKEAAGISEKDIVINNIQAGPVNTTHDIHKGAVKSDASKIVYFEVSNEQVQAMFAMAEKIFTENGGDINTDPFWKRIKSEPGFKETTMQQVKDKFRNSMHTHQEVNKQFLSGK